MLAFESAIRLLGDYDLDGNFIIFGRTLRPYQIPAMTMQQKVAEYLAAGRTSIRYDARLGWAPRPDNISSNGLYAYNSYGIRTSTMAPVEYPMSPAENRLRVLIIGDSYSRGDEIPFENSWGYLLEKKLLHLGINAEVINMAVGAYGMDQAFLRWQEHGQRLSPDIVLFGLLMENVQRNVNLLKPIYQPNTGLPFSKPRFIIVHDGLQLINVPTLPPLQLSAILKNPSSWSLIPHEHFLGPKYSQDPFWLNSRLAALIQEAVSPVESDPFFYDLDNESAILTLSLIHRFKQEIEAAGSDLLIVHIPIILDLIRLRLARQPVYTDLMKEIEKDTVVIPTQDALLEKADQSSLFSLYMPGGHYSAEGNEVIAGEVAAYIAASRQL
ncbi:MAG: SGNH/GDSL hydrolase family protein [Desulfobacterales bacterium]|nr:SGNH/GDSL hydrolase family protein [Desulfobacterales bacterium]